MKFGLDVLGGDFAPGSTIDGAIAALDSIGKDDRIVLLGPEDLIRKSLVERGVDAERFEISHQPECIEMDEKPMKALMEKPRSGIAAGLRMLAAGELDSFASAGNSGAVLAGAVTLVKCLPGVLRPCTCAWVPQEDSDTFSLLLDIGTTPDAKPEVMLQFGVIGSIYSRHVLGRENPRVCLMNVGTEDGKGNLQCQASFPLLKECPHVNFVGNLEPRDLFKGKAEVFVADGFVGNILLKEIETFYRMLQKRGIKDPLFERCNYEIYGGSPILGVGAPVMLGHGISSALAIKNILLQSKRMCEQHLVDVLREVFASYVGGTGTV